MSTAAPSTPLPFSLTPEDLANVEIHYGVYSSKVGAGVEEVLLRGGRVLLRRTSAHDAPPSVREGPLPPAALVPLLRVMAAQRFLDLPAESRASVPTVRRIIKLVAPRLSKQVAIDGEGDPRFERVVGALLATASQGRADVLDGTFFKLIGFI